MDTPENKLSGNTEKHKFLRGILQTEFSAHSMQALFTAWLICAAVCILSVKPSFNDLASYMKDLSFVMMLISTAVIWQLLTLIPVFKSRSVINCITVSSAILLAVTAASENKEIMFLTGLCAAVALTIKFADIPFYDMPDYVKKSGAKVKWSVAALLMLVIVLFVGSICCLKYFDHWTSCFDFGIFSQMFHYMKETGLPLTTCERDGLLTHFAVHVSPIYYLMLPIYCIFPSPATLLILQPLVVVSGVIPLLLICKKHSLSQLEGLLFAVCYIVFPSFTGGCFYYLHENCFLAPLIMWLIYFLETDRTLLSCVFALLLLLVKEDAAVYACVIALYFVFADRSGKKCRLTSAGIFVFSLAYFVVITGILAKYGDGVMSWRYKNYSYDGSDNLVAVFKTAAADPVYVIQQCFTAEKLTFILQMLLPLAFLPFLLHSPKELIMLIPFVLINLMTNYGYQHDINYQYTFGSGAALIYLAVVNYSYFDRGGNAKKRYKVLLTAAACCVTLFVGLQGGRADSFSSYIKNEETRGKIDYALSLIPEDASVVSSTFLLPNLSQRDELYQLETTKHEAEYYVLDLRYNSDEFSADDYKNDDYEEIYYDDTCVAVYRNKNYSG